MARARSIIGVLLTLSSLCAAAEPASTELAKEHLRNGESYYRQGDYPHALEEFLEANKLAPHRAFVLNAGQCYRKLGDLPHALESFESYLFQSSSDDPWEKKVRQWVVEVRAELAARSSRAEPISPTPILTPPPVGAQPVVVPVAVVPSAVPPTRRPVWKRAWLWGTVAGVIVAGTALGLGLGLGLSHGAPHPALGTITF